MIHAIYRTSGELFGFIDAGDELDCINFRDGLTFIRSGDCYREVRNVFDCTKEPAARMTVKGCQVLGWGLPATFACEIQTKDGIEAINMAKDGEEYVAVKPQAPELPS